MLNRPSFTLYLLLLTALPSLQANVFPAPLFTENAVLQRDKPIPVWGMASPGEKVVVKFASQSIATVASEDGKWQVMLAPLPAISKGADLVIQGDNTITLGNVVVGEVWLASGQSNMEWQVKKTYDQAIDIPASTRLPLIRHVAIRRTVANSPADTTELYGGGVWQVASADTTGDFSAVGYYFAKSIHELTGVPIGIINSSWGGSRIDGWINAEAYAAIPAQATFVYKRWEELLAAYPEALVKYQTELSAWEKERAKVQDKAPAKPKPFFPQGPGHRNTPSGLYNAMINPLVPYAIRGAIWYQGESNTGRASEYHNLFAAMIQGWRAKFGQGDFPFYWVQLANFQSTTGTSWAFLREAQTQTLSLPETGQAVTIDIGNVDDIHPRNKRDVGRRLARLALNRTYGINMPDSGPVFAEAKREGNGFRVSFSEVQGGLVSPLNDLGGFELAGEDQVFKPAKARLDSNTVFVSSADIVDPVAVRYAWRNAPLAGLFNREGLPAVPFRTDDW